MLSSTQFSPENFDKLRGLAFSDKCECLRSLITLIINIMADLEFLEYEISELQEKKGETNE